MQPQQQQQHQAITAQMYAHLGDAPSPKKFHDWSKFQSWSDTLAHDVAQQIALDTGVQDDYVYPFQQLYVNYERYRTMIARTMLDFEPDARNQDKAMVIMNHIYPAFLKNVEHKYRYGTPNSPRPEAQHAWCLLLLSATRELDTGNITGFTKQLQQLRDTYENID